MRILIAGGSRNGYQTLRVQEEARKRGHSAEVGKGATLQARFAGDAMSFTINGEDILAYDMVWMHCTRKYQALWRAAAEYMRRNGKVSTDQRSRAQQMLASTAGDYSMACGEHIRIPKSVVSLSVRRAVRAAEEIGYPCIMKTTESRKGRGVGLAHTSADIETFFQQHDRPGLGYVIRELIPNDGDLRVLVIGGKALGAMYRQPKAGEFRANISQGGTGSIFDLTARPDVQTMAERAAAVCGLGIAGVDIMLHRDTGEAYLLEVNESPQIQGFESYTGLNAAEAIVTFFESLS